VVSVECSFARDRVAEQKGKVPSTPSCSARLTHSRLSADAKIRSCATLDAMSAMRSEHLGASYKTTYHQPLLITHAEQQYIYDADGRQFLDAYNNVPHVGHCHPRVAEAVATQMAILQTNSRYLYPHLPQYAARLASLFPDPLDTVFLVNSGSEANDLALRLAFAWTKSGGGGAPDAPAGAAVITHGDAYHGNSLATMALSPTEHYNNTHAQSMGVVLETAAVPAPCTYRYPDLTGAAAARKVTEAMAGLRDSRGQRTAAMIVETIQGVGGQVMYPPGYLELAARGLRSQGGLLIVDEVQTGFGRCVDVATGDPIMWAFEDSHHSADSAGSGGAASSNHRSSLVPDIVTLGKPIGNGFPMAAVVTRREIAAAMSESGSEFFNTFGGGPVACAAGMAVLDVLEDEGLVDNCADVGRHLMDGLGELMATHEEIGDVRGRGLFLGVELVLDKQSKRPNARLCNGVVNAMKESGILTSYDGPGQNVLRFKPPLCFTRSNANQLLSALDMAIVSRREASAVADGGGAGVRHGNGNRNRQQQQHLPPSYPGRITIA
jgi:4-aminobutyrate aminotransferase-like enzyme